MYDPSKPFKNDINRQIAKTWDIPSLTIKAGVYPVFKRRSQSVYEVDHTDGIGTKGFYHWQQGTFKAAAIDALAMNLNDLALVRAIPYKLSDHVTVPVEDERVLAIIKEIVGQCLKYRIAIVGGENSFHNNAEGLDISMTVSGFVEKPIANEFKPGNILIGLPSNGLHSNGFSLVRKIFKDQQRPEFTKPTAIYLYKVLELDAKIKIYGLMHITGGAFTKLKDLLVKADAIIDKPLRPQPIYREIYQCGVKDEQMYKTFNCGTGFVLAVAPTDTAITQKITAGEIIGRVEKGNGQVIINSAFSNKQVQY